MKGKFLLIGVVQLILTLFLFSSSIAAQTKVQGYVQDGGFQFSGSSVARIMRSYPSATVTVYLAGTTTLASIYSNKALTTPKANPFVADSKAFYGFYVSKNANYDVMFSGGGLSAPFTLGDITSNAATLIMTAEALGAVANANMTNCAGTDATSTLQAFLNLASDGVTRVELQLGGNFVVSGLNLYSNTTISKGGLCLKNASHRAVLRNANRTSNINAIIDNNITVRDIKINGNRSGQNKTEGDSSFVQATQWYGVKNLKLFNNYVTNNRNYGFHGANVNGVLLDGNWHHQPDYSMDNHACVQFDGNSYNINIVNQTCENMSDDGIALNAFDDPVLGPYVINGPIQHVTIDNTNLINCYMGVRILSGNERIDDITINNTHGTLQEYVLRIGKWGDTDSGGPGNIGTVSLLNTHYTTFMNVDQEGYNEAVRIEGKIEVLNVLNFVQNDINWYDGKYHPIVRVLGAGDHIGRGDIKLANFSFFIYDGPGSVVPLVGAFRAGRLMVEGNIETCNYFSVHRRDSSVNQSLGAVQVRATDLVDGISTLNFGGIYERQFNLIVLEQQGKITRINVDNAVDLANAGVFFYLQGTVNNPFMSGNLTGIGSTLLGGLQATNVQFESLITNQIIRSNGDVVVPVQGKGLVLRATDGANCYRVTVNNAGTIATTLTACPQ